LTTQINISPGSVLVDPERWERQVIVIAEGAAEVRSGARVLDRFGPGAVFGGLAIRPQESRAMVCAATHMIAFVLNEVEWRSLPQHLRSAVDVLLDDSARRLRELGDLNRESSDDRRPVHVGMDKQPPALAG
jgi:signal-transduction protein with cAMP-binding, CBS, and nucleotidyltransferase domain